jgi:hypothetical protein
VTKAKKKQHYVPQFYLRGFTTRGRQLQVFDKPLRRSFSASVMDVASQAYFYDLDGQIDGAQKKSQVVEDFLGVVESDAAVHIATLLKGLDRGEPLDPSVKAGIAMWLAVQFFRTPEIRVATRQVWDSLRHALRNEKLAPELERGFEEWGRPESEAVVQAGLLVDPASMAKVVDVLLSHFWFVGVNNTNLPLWTSDHPVTRSANSEDAACQRSAKFPTLVFN